MSQLGEAGNLKAPSLVVGEVELPRVDFVIGQQIHKALEFSKAANVVAGNIEMETTILEVGPVDDEAVLQAVALAVVQSGDEGLDTVHQGRTRDTTDDDAAVMHTQAVILTVLAHLLIEQ